MEIHHLADTSDDILNKLDVLVKDCEPGFPLVKVRELAKQNKINTDILFFFDTDEPIYMVLLDIFPRHKMIYIHDVCGSKSHRGKGLFKISLAFLKQHYPESYMFTLDASHIKKDGLDQKARIHIFHSAGFDINPETAYFTESADYNIIKTRVVFDSGKIGEIQKKEGDTYIVTSEGKEVRLKIDQIDQCLGIDSTPISCPMILVRG